MSSCCRPASGRAESSARRTRRRRTSRWRRRRISFSQLRDVFVEATRANTAIYTLDPRGLAPSEFGIDDNVRLDADRDVLNESTDTLRSIAGETDGRAIVGRNNPIPSWRRCGAT